jgi:hypothetical protein
MKLASLALLVAVLGAPLPALAGELTLSFNDGRVTLKATDVPVRQVLAEWARLGKTRIVGLEKVTGPPVTLQLDNVPEKKALEILLRSVAGYAVASRQVALAGASQFDRVALLPTSVASAAPAGGPRPAAFAPPAPQMPFPDPIQLANEEPDQQPQQPGAPMPQGAPAFTPAGDPLRGGGSADVLPSPPGVNPIQPGPQQQVPPPLPGGTTPPMAPGPVLADRPGVLPVPQQQQQQQQLLPPQQLAPTTPPPRR